MDRKWFQKGQFCNHQHVIASSYVLQFLVLCKLGSVVLWPFGTVAQARIFRLSTQKLSIGSSSLSPVSGIIYDRHHDSVIVSLSDGSFHVIRNISTEPFLSSASIDAAPSTQMLSNVSRGVFLDTKAISYDADLEGGEQKSRSMDVNRIAGVLSYDDWSSVAWLHE
jgi:general transcription factor 3C polypeptide 4